MNSAQRQAVGRSLKLDFHFLFGSGSAFFTEIRYPARECRSEFRQVPVLAFNAGSPISLHSAEIGSVGIVLNMTINLQSI